MVGHGSLDHRERARVSRNARARGRSRGAPHLPLDHRGASKGRGEHARPRDARGAAPDLRHPARAGCAPRVVGREASGCRGTQRRRDRGSVRGRRADAGGRRAYRSVPWAHHARRVGSGQHGSGEHHAGGGGRSGGAFRRAPRRRRAERPADDRAVGGDGRGLSGDPDAQATRRDRPAPAGAVRVPQRRHDPLPGRARGCARGYPPFGAAPAVRVHASRAPSEPGRGVHGGVLGAPDARARRVHAGRLGARARRPVRVRRDGPASRARREHDRIARRRTQTSFRPSHARPWGRGPPLASVHPRSSLFARPFRRVARGRCRARVGAAADVPVAEGEALDRARSRAFTLRRRRESEAGHPPALAGKHEARKAAGRGRVGNGARSRPPPLPA